MTQETCQRVLNIAFKTVSELFLAQGFERCESEVPNGEIKIGFDLGMRVGPQHVNYAIFASKKQDDGTFLFEDTKLSIVDFLNGEQFPSRNFFVDCSPLQNEADDRVVECVTNEFQQFAKGQIWYKPRT